MTTPPARNPHSAGATPPRRSFLVKAASVLVGGIVTLVPIVLGMLSFLSPLIRKPRPSGGDEFIKIGTVNSLSPGGPPRLFQVTGIKHDAWTTYPQTELGAVYVRLEGEGEDVKPVCFNARCPHLGCTVNFRPEQERYVCPCHDSSFSLDGARSNDIPPRDMDPLEIEIRNGNELWVRFQNFRAGKEERIPIA